MFGIPDETKTIRAQLLAAMKDGEYSGCDRLPRESVLSELLGISRTQLRDILASLEREGFITRRHGVGTIINHHVLNVPARMDIEMEFMDMIRASGHTPDVSFARVEEGTASSQEAELLQIAEGTPVLRFLRLCTADGKPAIYCFLDLLNGGLVADVVRAGFLGLMGLVALGENQHADGLAGAVGQDHRTADLLVSVTGVDAQTDGDFHGLIELGLGGLADQFHGVNDVILNAAIDQLSAVFIFLTSEQCNILLSGDSE